MAQKSAFRPAIQYDNTTWHLVFDPASNYMVAPNLQGARISPLTVNKVVFPGSNAPCWIATLGVIFPAGVDSVGRVVNERRMLGFRTFDYEPPKQLTIPYNELAYYVAEPSTGADSAAQQFLNAVAGYEQSTAEPAQSEQTDISWTQRFAEREEYGQPVPATTE